MRTQTTAMPYFRRTLFFCAGLLVLTGAPGWASAQTEETPDTQSEQKPAEDVESAPSEDTGASVESHDSSASEQSAPASTEGNVETKDEDDTKPEDEGDVETKDKDDAKPKEETPAAKEGVEVIEVTGRTIAGSAHFIDEEYLERYEHDDVLKVLQSVPGVYIRQEDGYGLRPNIGMRGSGSERSAKIVLMEDEIPFAPAPYSAPAAYYFPILTKMIGIEVLKGPSAIRYGPNTVGGSVNLLTRPIPVEHTIGVDLAGGTDMYGKAHVYYGDSTTHFGWLLEGVKLRSDGFKKLDNNGPTGFDKNDISAQFRINSSPSASVYHELELRVGYADEVSHETYTGLTTNDFHKTPYRRYAASQLDLMEWEHKHARLTYRVSTPSFDIKAKLYRNDFHRDWFKLNRLRTNDLDYSLNVIMVNPKGINLAYYDVLTGNQDTYNYSQQLMVGSNDRYYVSQGLQLAISTEQYWFGWSHSMELGTRLHYDHVERYHTEEPYNMRSGILVRSQTYPTIELQDVKDSTRAWASYYQHQAQYGAWTVSAGARGELIDARHEGEMRSITDAPLPPLLTDYYFVLIPGAGVVYRPIPELELLAGVHKGFVPKNPSQGEHGTPELSINYEAGLRFNSRRASLVAIGFFSNFGNLIGTCSFSTGCSSDAAGLEFSGGSVHSYGAELDGMVEFPVHKALTVPLRLSYTYQHATFQEFFISGNPQWGIVFAGYELPYLPKHQVYVSTGLRGKNWNVEGYGHYTGWMRDVASIERQHGIGSPTEPTFVIHASARYTFGSWGSLYLTVENVLDQPYIVSRRPMGSRSGVPRRFALGYKNKF